MRYCHGGIKTEKNKTAPINRGVDARLRYFGIIERLREAVLGSAGEIVFKRVLLVSSKGGEVGNELAIPSIGEPSERPCTCAVKKKDHQHHIFNSGWRRGTLSRE